MNAVREYALRMLGIPYRWNGKTPIEGFDCSGLVSELLRSAGILDDGELRTAQDLYDALESNASHNLWGMGSLAFYGKSLTKIEHVGFCLDDKRMIEAGGGDHLTLTRSDAAARGAFVRIRPIKSRPDLLAILKPSYAKIGCP